MTYSSSTGRLQRRASNRVFPLLFSGCVRSGDRLQPLGSLYVKKLKAFLIDAKIPHGLRDRLPLVVTSTGIAWVAGVRPAEWAKVTPSTRVILRLQLSRHAPEK